MHRTITEAMAHDHIFGNWRGDGKWWCAVCSTELQGERVQFAFEERIRADERRLERARIEAWFRDADDGSCQTLAMYLDSRGEE